MGHGLFKSLQSFFTDHNFLRDSLEDIMKIFGVEEDENAEDGFIFLSEDES